MRAIVKKRLWKQAAEQIQHSRLIWTVKGTMRWQGFKRVFRDLKKAYRRHEAKFYLLVLILVAISSLAREYQFAEYQRQTNEVIKAAARKQVELVETRIQLEQCRELGTMRLIGGGW